MKKYYLFFLSAVLGVSSLAIAQPTVPPAPLTCNGGNCTPAVSETCTGSSTVVTNFTGATLRSGSPTSLPALYTFYNIATISGQQINATVTVESQLNCNMSGTNFNIDDDGAVDQANVSIAGFFAPRIRSSSNTLGNTDIRGYVQFTIRFYLENGTGGQQYTGNPGDDYSTPPAGGGLTGLNYIHYDIDGSTVGTGGGWFRETGVVQNVVGSVINGDVSTELAPYTYTDGPNWKGFAGSVCERSGVSRCSQVAVAATYSTPQTSITFRMGYDYNYQSGSTYGTSLVRQYGSRFGCFSFPSEIPLPVKLISFSGTYKNNNTLLNWTAENQVDFVGYEIERSEDGISFNGIALVNKQGTGLERQQYQYTDNLAQANGNVYYYRLRMMDIDGKFKYSNVILIKRDGIKPGLSISPNPIISGGAATVRFETSRKGTVELRIADMSGKVVLRQQNIVYEGANSVAINNLNRLQPGMYMLQVIDGQEIQTTKISVAR